jgi:CelD/BcsL family acetyltransferase involved in cellulose biosynthesis
MRHAHSSPVIRISNAGDKWSNCSPGRLIIERTMAALHKDGVRELDFSVGNYAYKRRFGVMRLPLVDISAGLELARMALSACVIAQRGNCAIFPGPSA